MIRVRPLVLAALACSFNSAVAADSPSAPGMVFLQGGTYSKGKITVEPFLLDATEVTAGAYAECVKAGKCSLPLEGDARTYGVAGKENHPINWVDWNQAAAYCAFVWKRLPSDEEWEWAARGAELGTTYPWGKAEPGAQLCWSGSGPRKETCAVGSFALGDTPQGIKDLAGSAWEWTSTAKGDSRASRGGSYLTDFGPYVAAVYRVWYPRVYRHTDVGFRCAKTP